MDIGDWGILLLIVGIITLLIIEFTAIILVVTAIASWLGVTGILWWAFVIVLFILVNTLLGALCR